MSIAEDVLVYAYVQTSDTGFAPCYDDGIWTLACCKPQIRNSVARRLDSECNRKKIYVIGLSSRSKYHEHKPIYIACVDRALKLSDYFTMYTDRKDSVYIKTEEKWLSKISNPHLHVHCKKECKYQAADVEVVDVEDDICWRDLKYRNQENYALISNVNDFVHFDKQKPINWSDNSAIKTIIDAVWAAPRAFQIFSPKDIDVNEFLRYFKTAQNTYSGTPVVPWDEDGCCGCCCN